MVDVLDICGSSNSDRAVETELNDSESFESFRVYSVHFFGWTDGPTPTSATSRPRPPLTKTGTSSNQPLEDLRSPLTAAVEKGQVQAGSGWVDMPC